MTATQLPTSAILVGKCAEHGLTRVEREIRVGVIEAGAFAGRPWRDIVNPHVDCRVCGRRLDSKQAKVSKTKCGAKCTAATGPACSCECGGKNHGGHGAL